jgi:hypothetical protein
MEQAAVEGVFADYALYLGEVGGGGGCEVDPVWLKTGSTYFCCCKVIIYCT